MIPEKGSVGSSGDLCPLAHMVLPMIGLGDAEYKGVVTEGAEAMKKAGIAPITLKAKEGLALINGTQCMTSVAAHAYWDALVLAKSADIVGAMTIESLRITRSIPHTRYSQTTRADTGGAESETYPSGAQRHPPG